MRSFRLASGAATIVLAQMGLPPLCGAQQNGAGMHRLQYAEQPDVLTYHNDLFRTGEYLSEKELTPESVRVASFGKLFSVLVDGKVDAQPLYVSGLRMPGASTADVVYAVTEHDSVYAFDAQTGKIYWQKSLLAASETTSDPLHCSQVIPEIGITATPVINREVGPHGTIYIVAMSKDGSGGYHQRIHALDLATGAEQLGGPTEIQASYPGTGREINSGGNVVFDPKQHEDRAALLLSQGVVYTSWSSHCDIEPYTGWVIGFDAQNLKQSVVFNFTPNGSEGSLWNSGAGPAADTLGNLYFSVANGTFDTDLNSRGFPSMNDYGNALAKLRHERTETADQALTVADYWTMYNTVDESAKDEDLGSGGIVLLPDLLDQNGRLRQLAVAAGKDQNIYVADRNNMGKFNAGNNGNIYQELPGALAGREYGELAWFNGRVYIGAVNDSLKAFDVKNARLSATPSSSTANVFSYPGTNPIVSADGNRNAILWAFDNGSSQAVLHAYDPSDLSVEFYNSNQAPGGRDSFGAGNKFISPTVASGHVYIGTTNSVVAFGLLK